MAYSITDNCIGCGACVGICPTGAVSGEKKSVHQIDGSLCIECSACGRVCPKSAVLDSAGAGVSRLKKKQWLKPRIIVTKCFACENCVEACPASALTMSSEELSLAENYAVLSSPGSCVSCGWCVENCQFDAIVMEVPGEND